MTVQKITKKFEIYLSGTGALRIADTSYSRPQNSGGRLMEVEFTVDDEILKIKPIEVSVDMTESSQQLAELEKVIIPVKHSLIDEFES
jgi:hypothetical protein